MPQGGRSYHHQLHHHPPPKASIIVDPSTVNADQKACINLRTWALENRTI
jgi:hypothetical protein